VGDGAAAGRGWGSLGFCWRLEPSAVRLRSSARALGSRAHQHWKHDLPSHTETLKLMALGSYVCWELHY